MSWLRTIIQHVDYLRGRYIAFRVTSEADRAGCMAVLDEVRRNELRRVHGSSTLQSSAFADVKVDDRLYAIRDTQVAKIVGCIRSTPAIQLAGLSESRSEYHLEQFPSTILELTRVYTRLAVLREYRKTAATVALFRQIYDDALAEASLASLLSCEPGLYPGYLRLGFRPLGPVHQGASGGFRIPMVSINHDLEHLKHVRSPMLVQLAAFRGSRPDVAIRWYREFEARNGPIDPGVAFYSDDSEHELHAPLTRGLSDAGRAEMLRNAVEIDCHAGDVIISAGDGGRNMGFVARGLVQVETGGRVIAMLGQGEVFGEMAVVLDAPRTANVVASTADTRVLMLSQSCLQRLDDSADLAVVWRNLARVLAARLHVANE